ncbi:GNAT family N-acetyltransferase [Allokutzneria oryzae]|uniref:GNAT family N-acetyltransferase n=1 Tax=Allokutzneria oryzae TaxID=1378989 RepID=A0ABV6A145_9PSEU
MAELTEVTEYDQVAALFGEIWSTDIAASPVPAELMCALRLAGNYIAGAYDGTELIGASVGFFDSAGGLHSHIAGVRTGHQGRGVGLALKLHQWDWAISRGLKAIHWTFDPLVRRNGYFNLVKLGARPVRYLPNFYGPMAEGDSDRFLVEWSLTEPLSPVSAVGPTRPLLTEGLDGEPLPRFTPGWDTSPALSIRVPKDIEALRRKHSDVAARWRSALRDAVGLAVAGGYAFTGMTSDGSYVLTREAA